MNHAALILASGSPRRRELLSLTGLPYVVDAPEVDESCALPPEEAVQEISRRKGLAGAAAHPGCVVLSADTLVAVDGKALGKPHSEEEAFQMLSLLSGRWHQVYTGVCAVDAQDPFGIDEVCNRLVDKLITRHPHVFQSDDAADASAPAPENAQDTLKLWEAMKQKEKHRKSVLEGISHAQGALPRATKIVSRVHKSQYRDQLETAFNPSAEQTDEQHDSHPYADEIIAIIRKAQGDGVDVESDLRCRLRDIESEIEHIERTMNHE